MTPIDPSQPGPNECRAFASALQAVLDRELSFEKLARSHADACPGCRELILAVETLTAGLDQTVVASPSGELTDRIVRSVHRDYRRRRAMRLTASGMTLAVAAAVVMVVGYLAPWKDRPAERDLVGVGSSPVSPAPALPTPPERVADRIADAGSALASITRKASDQALSPTRTLSPAGEPVTFAPADLPPGIEPAAESLTAMPEAARSGLEPVTSGARRAVNLFLRDTGFGSVRPKS